MSKHVVVIGAVALGPKAASRMKRLDPSIKVTMIDRDNYISYGGCGIPYYVGGDVAELEGLCSTSAHVVRDKNYFGRVKDVTVLTQTEALVIDRPNKAVSIRNLINLTEDKIYYDQLVLGLGASPIIPEIPGIDLPGVTAVTNLHQARMVKKRVSKGKVERAVIIGGGAIGIEMAEALTDLWGVETTVIEMLDQLLPQSFGQDMTKIIENHMQENGVQLLLNEGVTKIIGDQENGVQEVETTKSKIPCDLVIMAVGVRPNTNIARSAGLAVGRYGGLIVDNCLRTVDPNIYAGGDCIEMQNLITGQYQPMPLGSLANRHGRIIGTNIVGGCDQFKGTVGSFCLKVFEMGIARAGITFNQAKNAGFDPVHTVVLQGDRAHFYPSMDLMAVKLIADRRTRQILGIEAVGKDGDAVKARVDAVASILPYKPTVSDISNLEVSYAPPYASAMDIINASGNSLENILEGRQESIDVIEFLESFKSGKIRVLDVRSPLQADSFVEKYGEQWFNIDQIDLRKHLDDIPLDKELMLICGSGARSYEAQLLLKSKGVNVKTRNIQGGIGMLKFSAPDFVPKD
ncbi:FAD-dependent pyridine nucleotide-disulfide oxidoreductase [Candidatus Magnetomorum sp. HK-1]|nr:FAD-dependent pyridine nucleotide-disulfide oxidoreductase [Candidatus Magnetomorum sp. HK-1]